MCFRMQRAQSILIAKSCISNPCGRCLCDDPCLSKFGAPPRKLSVKQQTILGLLCSTYLHSRIEHNRAKPMSESASALFSIADAGEFRFARFYDVYA